MKSLADPVRKVNAHVLGLDVHKRNTVWTLLDRKGATRDRGQIASEPAELERLVREQIGRKKAHVAFEASGCSLWVYDLLCDLLGPRFVHAAHAKHIRAIANSKRKNDANDSWWLAYLTYEGRLPEAWHATGAYRDLRVATRARTSSVQERTRAMTDIRAHVRQMGKGRLLAKGALSNQPGRRQVLEWAAEVGGATGAALLCDLERIAQLDTFVARWDAQVEELAKPLPQVAAVQEHIPGTALTLAATIVAEIGPIQRFPNPKALACYAGLTPTDRSTDGTRRGGAITKQGSRALRWALVQAVVHCLQCRKGPGVHVAHWVRLRYERLNSKKKAQVAGARKLAEAVWRLLATGEFSAMRSFGRAPMDPYRRRFDA